MPLSWSLELTHVYDDEPTPPAYLDIELDDDIDDVGELIGGLGLGTGAMTAAEYVAIDEGEPTCAEAAAGATPEDADVGLVAELWRAPTKMQAMYDESDPIGREAWRTARAASEMLIGYARAVSVTPRDLCHLFDIRNPIIRERMERASPALNLNTAPPPRLSPTVTPPPDTPRPRGRVLPGWMNQPSRRQQLLDAGEPAGLAHIFSLSPRARVFVAAQQQSAPDDRRLAAAHFLSSGSVLPHGPVPVTAKIVQSANDAAFCGVPSDLLFCLQSGGSARVSVSAAAARGNRSPPILLHHVALRPRQNKSLLRIRWRRWRRSKSSATATRFGAEANLVPPRPQPSRWAAAGGAASDRLSSAVAGATGELRRLLSGGGGGGGGSGGGDGSTRTWMASRLRAAGVNLKSRWTAMVGGGSGGRGGGGGGGGALWRRQAIPIDDDDAATAALATPIPRPAASATIDISATSAGGAPFEARGEAVNAAGGVGIREGQESAKGGAEIPRPYYAEELRDGAEQNGDGRRGPLKSMDSSRSHDATPHENASLESSHDSSHDESHGDVWDAEADPMMRARIVPGDELDAALAHMDMRRPVMVTLANDAFHAMLLNWWFHVSETASIPNVLVGALDRSTAELCRQRGIPHVHLRTGLPSDDFRADAGTFQRMGVCKTALLTALLERARDVVLSDTDVVWLRDPYNELYLGAMRHADVMVSSDSLSHANDEASLHVDPLNNTGEEGAWYRGATARGKEVFGNAYEHAFNTGVLLLRACPHMLQFALAWHHAMRTKGASEGWESLWGDQHAFNLLLRYQMFPIRVVTSPLHQPTAAAAATTTGSSQQQGVLPISTPPFFPLTLARHHGEQRSAHSTTNSAESGAVESSAAVAASNRVIWAFNGQLRVAILPLALVPNGHVFFVQQPHGSPHQHAIHNTFQFHHALGKAARFREAGLWAVDPPENYEEGNYLSMEYSTPPWIHAMEPGMLRHQAAMEHFYHVAQKAFALAWLLSRKIILPRVTCFCDRWWDSLSHPCRAPGSDRDPPFVCPLDYLISPLYWGSNATDMVYRPASFLEDPRTSEEIKASRRYVSIDYPDASSLHHHNQQPHRQLQQQQQQQQQQQHQEHLMPHQQQQQQPPDPLSVYGELRLPMNATDKEVLAVLGQPHVHEVRVLHLLHPHDTFCRFVGQRDAEAFDAYTWQFFSQDWCCTPNHESRTFSIPPIVDISFASCNRPSLDQTPVAV
ncbi:unnamed protein product [Closterium sp. NIES-64]|nr:unnamed protein product [Closterium sp. NIES-64]